MPKTALRPQTKQYITPNTKSYNKGNIQKLLTSTNPNQAETNNSVKPELDEEEQFAVEADSLHSPHTQSNHPVNRLAQAVSQIDRQINQSKLTESQQKQPEPIVDKNASFDEQPKM